MKFGRKLEEIEGSLPPGWQGHMLQYRRLKSLIKNQCLDGEFFTELSNEVTRINAVFVKSAISILHGHKMQSSDALSGCFCFLRTNKRISLPTGASIPVSQDNILVHSRACIEYSKANALGLRKIIKKYDKCSKGDRGQQALADFWQDQSGKSFLHSPMLLELTAIHTEVSDQAVTPVEGNKVTGVVDASTDMHRTLPPDDSWLESLQCPICLDIPYKPIALACSHMFCKDCLFRATGHDRILGMTSNVLRCIDKSAQCPQCRQTNVFARAVVLSKTSNLLQKRYPDYWAERSVEEQEHLKNLRREYAKSREANVRKLRGFHPSYLLF